MKKEFEIPELVIIKFANEDVIATSAGASDPYGEGYDEYQQG